MGIGGSIFLIVVGAILAFAVDVTLQGIDLDVVGWVMMLAGLAGLILTLWFWQSRRRTVVAAPVDERRVVRESRTDYGPTDRPL